MKNYAKDAQQIGEELLFLLKKLSHEKKVNVKQIGIKPKKFEITILDSEECEVVYRLPIRDGAIDFTA